MDNKAEWTPAEKKIAHEAYSAAYERECTTVVAEARTRLAQIRDAEDIWDLQEYLTKRRREFERKYDFRYSQLRMVFGILCAEGWLQLEELAGLAPDKIEAIKSAADFLSGKDD